MPRLTLPGCWTGEIGPLVELLLERYYDPPTAAARRARSTR